MFKENTKSINNRHYNNSVQTAGDDVTLCLPSKELGEVSNKRLIRRKEPKPTDFYKDLFENLYELVLVVDAESGIIVESSNITTKLYGYKKHELIGKSVYELCAAPDDLKLKIDELLTSAIPLTFESAHVTKSGKILYLDVHASIINKLPKRFIVLSIHNGSNNKTAKKELKILSEIVKQSPSTVLLTNTEGKIEYVNQKFSEITGYSVTEAIGKTPEILRNKANSPAVYRNLWKTIKAGNTWKGEFINTKKNGEPYWASSVIAPIKNESGEPTHYLSIEQDITDKKDLEIELKLALSKANEINKFRTQLLGNLNHEVRTPLNTIIGFAQFIKDESFDEISSGMSTKIIESSLRLLKTLNSIIELSDLESDRIKVQMSDINLSDLLRYVEFNFQEAAKEKGLNFNLKLLEEDVFIKSDEKILEQAIVNLVDNAIKYTEFGEIAVSMNTKEDNGRKFAEIRITDTGIGIPESSKNLIFEPFRQSSEGHTRQFEGTGLGLTISQRMIKLLSGKIHFETRLGKGSTFTVHLPVVPD